MHFTTLFILKNANINEITPNDIMEIFGDRFCYCNGETTPKYQFWCDWFQIGGRWPDILKAKNGIHCQSCWSNDYFKPVVGSYSIVQISDLTEPIDEKQIYSIATLSQIYIKEDTWQSGNVNPDKFNELLNKINNKQINGVIALLDCHD